jgi:DNA-binding CsgD family transcriptional regulator
LAENAGFRDAPKRGNYKPHERIHTKQKIYKMLLDGRSNQSIMSELGISERTFYRYRDIIFAQEQDFLEETVTYEDLRRQMILARDRLLDDRNEIQEWLIQNPNAQDRVELANLRAELTAAVLRLYAKGPVKFARSRNNNNLPDNYTAAASSSPPPLSPHC